MQYTRPGLLSAESGWEVKRHLKIPVRSRCTVRLKWCSCSILEVPIGCSSILSVLYCAGSATGGKGGRIKYLVLKGERVKVELYQWRQLSHDRLYITSVLSINLRIVAFFSKCDTKIRRSFKSCIVQITCAKLYYQELYSIHCRLYRILTFVCGNFKTYLLFVHQIISSVLVFQESFYMKMSKTQWRHKSYLKIWLWIVETVFRFWCFHFVVCMWCHNDHVFDAVMYHGKE